MQELDKDSFQSFMPLDLCFDGEEAFHRSSHVETTPVVDLLGGAAAGGIGVR